MTRVGSHSPHRLGRRALRGQILVQPIQFGFGPEFDLNRAAVTPADDTRLGTQGEADSLLCGAGVDVCRLGAPAREARGGAPSFFTRASVSRTERPPVTTSRAACRWRGASGSARIARACPIESAPAFRAPRTSSG